MSLGVGLSVMLVCLVLQGFFSGSEMALVSANRARLAVSAQEGQRGARLALQLLSQEERLLGTCLIGTNLSVITGATVAALLLFEHGFSQEWLATLLFAPVALVFGEALPKTVYQAHADLIAPIVAWPLRGAQLALSPALVVVSGWARLLERLTGSEGRPISREEIVSMLEDERGGDIDPDDRALIRNVLSINELTVYDAMSPLVDVWAVPSDATVGQAVQVVIQSGHSRLPVFEGRIDNLVGVVDHRDLLYGPPDSEQIAALVRTARFVPESKRVDELLADMRRDHDTFAVVVDEYGASAGIVTREDLLELLVGDIQDERDTDEPTIRRLSDHEWRIPGRTEIEEASSEIGVELPEGDYETIAGLILNQLGRIPDAGEHIEIGVFRFTIEAASERAIQLVRLTLAPPQQSKSN